QGQRLAHTVLALTERAHPPSDSRPMLAEGEVTAFHKRRIDLPARRSEHVLDGGQRAEYEATAHPYQAALASGLDHLDVEPPGQGHPAGLGRRACGPTALRLPPPCVVRAQRGHGFPKAVR